MTLLTHKAAAFEAALAAARTTIPPRPPLCASPLETRPRGEAALSPAVGQPPRDRLPRPRHPRLPRPRRPASGRRPRRAQCRRYVQRQTAPARAATRTPLPGAAHATASPPRRSGELLTFPSLPLPCLRRAAVGRPGDAHRHARPVSLRHRHVRHHGRAACARRAAGRRAFRALVHPRHQIHRPAARGGCGGGRGNRAGAGGGADHLGAGVDHAARDGGLRPFRPLPRGLQGWRHLVVSGQPPQSSWHRPCREGQISLGLRRSDRALNTLYCSI